MAVSSRARHLIVNGRFLSDTGTAVNAVARSLTQALTERARAPDATWTISVAVPPALEDAARSEGWPVLSCGKRSGILWEQLEFPRLARQGILAGFFNTVPLWGRGHVTMLHDAHVFSTPGSYGKATGKWRRFLSSRAGIKGNKVLTISHHSKAELLSWGIGTESGIGVAYNGLGPVGSAHPDRQIFDRLTGLDGAPYCIGLANLMPHKNIPLLLRAFADPAFSDLRLVLVGRADRAAFEAAGHAVPGNVLFPGFVSDGELAALYQSALSVCIPSTEEGFGLPALEGMAMGAPAIVSTGGALPEVVGEAGIVLSPDDPSDWITTIRRLHDDPRDRETWVEAGRKRAAGFTWSAAARTVEAHLDRWFPPS